MKIENITIRIFCEDDGDFGVEHFLLKNKHFNDNNIDLIVMDYNMNRMNGN